MFNLKIMCEKEQECRQRKEKKRTELVKQNDPLYALWKFLKKKCFPDKFIKELIEKGVTDEIKE